MTRERAAQVLVFVARGGAGDDASLAVQQTLASMGEQFRLVAEDDAEDELAQPGQAGAEPCLIVLLPAVQSPLQLARKVHRARAECHLVIVQEPAQLDSFRQALGVAPMLGRHWSLVAADGPALRTAFGQALSALRQRRQLRTTLSRVNARLAETRAVSLSDYQRLVASEHHLAHFLRNSRNAIIGLDPEMRVLFWSEGSEDLLGVAAGAAVGRPLLALGAWSGGVVRAMQEMRPDAIKHAVEFQADLDGREVALECLLTRTSDATGAFLGTSLMLRDVTARRRTQDQLREANLNLQQVVSERTQELEKSQLALVQAQKLEAIGRLTGGVAHDFNNLLQVIGSNLQLLQASLGPQPDAERLLRAALAAVDRGAKLSSQLLAFARRQPLNPMPLNISRQVQRMDELLRRALGEDLQVETVLAAGLWTTQVDANQLENVILNLAINARDAMPDGGQLTIETANAVLDEQYTDDIPDLSPGQYVMLAISDTGHGMPPDVVARAFEPFFTTKPEGKGTGLGMSMAYGFAKQSGGHIRIYSEVGAGTTIKLYLPRSFAKEVEPPPAHAGPVEGGSETVLVVEDDAAVQAAVVQTLQNLGYGVLRANDAQAALSILQSGVRVDLLFTDVVMPGPLRSTELARQARHILPGIAVLFTSGYTQNAIVHGGRLDPGVELLSKPYRQEDLARRIRDLLSRHRPVPGNARQAAPAAPGATPAADRRALRVLMVDDQGDLRDTSIQLLQMLGCEAIGAATAREARALLVEGGFDVLVTDINLPGESGLELADHARRADAKLKVVISSGYDAPPDAANQPRTWYLAKPYSYEELERLLEEIRRN
ncbi:MAG: domain S-box [Ramlibacter sp.]|nr:domain S-box [Ramlibacter sp.]